ncbi:MAG: hypothetical protein ABL958_15275 [Bdellovibrionia bacterium]
MKTIFSIFVLAFAVQAQAATPKLTCKGVSSTNLGAASVYVKTNPPQNTLSVAVVRAGQRPSQYDWHTLKVTKVVPMFPVTTVVASRDMRPVDGPLVEATLAISTEAVNPSTGERPARLTVTTTSPRGGTPRADRYQVACKLN